MKSKSVTKKKHLEMKYIKPYALREGDKFRLPTLKMLDEDFRCWWWNSFDKCWEYKFRIMIGTPDLDENDYIIDKPIGFDKHSQRQIYHKDSALKLIAKGITHFIPYIPDCLPLILCDPLDFDKLTEMRTPEELAQGYSKCPVMSYNTLVNNQLQMNYTPEQISSIVLKVLKEIETPDVSSLSYEEKIELARNPNTPQETLQVLATDKHYDVRCVVAQNQNTPQETLQVLATDENSSVRYRVAQNPNTPQETLKVLATDKNWVVRCRVAENPNTPQETLKVLATDVDYDVRRGVAKNPNTPKETLKVLATDEDSYVRCEVEQNPNYKKQTLELTSTQHEALKKLVESGQDESLKGLMDT